MVDEEEEEDVDDLFGFVALMFGIGTEAFVVLSLKLKFDKGGILDNLPTL